MGKDNKRSNEKSIKYGDADLNYSDQEYQISFEALIKIIKSIVGENDIGLLNCGKNNDHILIIVEDGNQRGGGFYDFKNRLAFNLTENWGDAIDRVVQVVKKTHDLFSETLYNQEKKDCDLLSEDEWRNHID